MTDAYYSKELDRIAADGNLRRLMPLEHTGCEVVVDGRNLLNLSSNDYLGLGADRELRAEFIAALRPEDFSMTSSSSRLLSGDFPVCEEVESMLAGMFGKEAALAFNSGYHMNLGILPAVAGKDTLIVADKLVHASIIDGIRLSGYDFYRFRHNDMDRVENILRQSSGKYRQVINSEYLHKCSFKAQHPDAVHMAGPACRAYKEKRFEDVAYFEPFYLKEFIAASPSRKLDAVLHPERS